MAPSSSRDQSSMPPRPGTKRSASTLLPAFEPFSSSPSLPRAPKRKLDDLEPLTYPTPIPTSSTAILSSSPHQSMPRGCSGLKRTGSVLSERAPLTAVPEIQLPQDGKKMLLGRSSATCDHQLSANRLISRVHVEAWYEPAVHLNADVQQGHGGGVCDRVNILCTGHNGIRVHCLGKVYGLDKGRTFSSDVRDVDIMVDVQDARVLIRWPEKIRACLSSSDEEEDDNTDSSPTRRRALLRHSTPPRSQLPRHRLASPVSPSPAVQAAMLSSPALHLPNSLSADPVVVYEDNPSPAADEDKPDSTMTTSQSTQALSQLQPTTQNLSSDSPLSSSQEFSDHDEENDPIIHSFGPFGANILSDMASFSATDSSHTISAKTRSHTQPLQPTLSPSQSQRAPESHYRDVFDITSHVINQLAFSRLSSTPLSTILSHLPSEADTLSKRDLKAILNQTACIGEIAREGKDAAGQPLESEYYYIPDQDEDEGRKEAVVNDLRKPGLRSCRKQHKV